MYVYLHYMVDMRPLPLQKMGAEASNELGQLQAPDSIDVGTSFNLVHCALSQPGVQIVRPIEPLRVHARVALRALVSASL